MDVQSGLGVEELLNATYSKLAERHHIKELTFPNPALSEIANDSDWHRTRVGYMYYNSAGLFDLKDKTWAIARGKKSGSYPGDIYVGDIIALDLVRNGKTEEKILEELNERIIRGPYFMNALLFGLDNGSLGIGKETRFGKKMIHLVSPRIEEFILQKPEYDTSVILVSTLQHPPTKVMLYKPETPDFLADSIEQVLKKQ